MTAELARREWDQRQESSIDLVRRKRPLLEQVTSRPNYETGITDLRFSSASPGFGADVAEPSGTAYIATDKPQVWELIEVYYPGEGIAKASELGLGHETEHRTLIKMGEFEASEMLDTMPERMKDFAEPEMPEPPEKHPDWEYIGRGAQYGV